MLNIIVQALLLHLIPIAIANDPSPTISCETAARRLAQPVDGWRIHEDVTGGVRREYCTREAVDLHCAPGTQFYRPDDREAECCPEDGTITWQDQEAKLGFCCATGHQWSGDLSSGEGGCCPNGMKMVDGQCTQPPQQAKEDESAAAGGGCGCSSKHGHSTSDSGDEDDDELVDTDTEEDQPGQDLGIRYGHCYLLSIADSKKQIGSNRENAVYKPGGLFQNIPFRVCRSTSDCRTGRSDENVLSDSLFFLQDQIGRHNDPTGTAGWIAKKDRGVLKMMFTIKTADATGFIGSKNASCMDGEDCGLRLSGLPKELLFNETSCLFYDRSEDEL